MSAYRQNLLSSGASRLVAAAIVVSGFCAAVAAAPAIGPLSAAGVAKPVVQRAALSEGATALRPFGQGPAIRVNRAYGAEDEDCVLAVTRVESADGEVAVTRGVSCAQ